MLTSKQALFVISESQSGLNAVCAGDREYSLLEVSSRRQCFVHVPRAIYTRHTAERASATYHLRDPVICNISRSTAPTLPTASVYSPTVLERSVIQVLNHCYCLDSRFGKIYFFGSKKFLKINNRSPLLVQSYSLLSMN